MNNVPKVSAICITYGRVKLLEEAIECFIRQDYPNKELVILNDDPSTTLVYDHPHVKIINLGGKVSSIGMKRNWASAYASGEYLMPWDDDDIHLPNRMTFSVNSLGGEPFKHFRDAAYCNAHQCIIKQTTLGSNCIYSRAIFEKVGGYTDMDSGQDHDLCNKFRRILTKDSFARVPYEETFYIYRWGVFPHLTHSRTSVEHHKTTDRYFRGGDKGVVVLEPQWHEDYTDIESVRVRTENVK